MKEKLSWMQIVENFSPTWFAVVMGTGALSIAFAAFRPLLPWVFGLQVGFFLLSVLFFVLLFVPWILRFFRFPEAIRRDLKHPVLSAFFPTMPISLLVIGISLEKLSAFVPETILPLLLLALWLLGTAGILGGALLLFTIFFEHPEIKWENASLAWLIPPVSTLLVPVLGFQVSLLYAAQALGSWIALISLAHAGIGTVLFLLVMSIAFGRYILHAPPPVHLTPTLMIGVAPTSLMTIISLRLPVVAEQVLGMSPSEAIVLTSVLKVGAIILWGFAVFWLLLTLAINLQMALTRQTPFALSWWAYIFPGAAFVIASGVLYQGWQHALFSTLGLSLLVIITILWGINLVLTVQGVRTGSLLRSHAAPAASSASGQGASRHT